MSTAHDNTAATLLPPTMDAADRHDLLTAMLSVLEYALIDGRIVEELSGKQMYEYMEMMKRIA